MVLGFRYLLVVALGFYLLSSAWGGKREEEVGSTRFCSRPL